MANENVVKSEVKSESKYNMVYVFKDTALKLNFEARKFTEIYDDSEEIVS